MIRKVALSVLAVLVVLTVVLSVAVVRQERRDTAPVVEGSSFSTAPFVRNETETLQGSRLGRSTPQKYVKVDGRRLTDTNMVVSREGAVEHDLELVLDLGDRRSRDVLLIDGPTMIELVNSGRARVEVALVSSTGLGALLSEAAVRTAVECPDRALPVLVRIARIAETLEGHKDFDSRYKKLVETIRLEGCRTVTAKEIRSGTFVEWSYSVARHYQSSPVPSISLDGVEKTTGSVTEEFTDG